jgi:hypothetical protein
VHRKKDGCEAETPAGMFPAKVIEKSKSRFPAGMTKRKKSKKKEKQKKAKQKERKAKRKKSEGKCRCNYGSRDGRLRRRCW